MSETMSIHRRESQSTIKELVMRFAPVSLVLAGLAALTASAGHSAAPEVLDPRALALQGQGRAALTAGDYDRATDGFEAALAISPGSASLVMDLAEVARREAMPGKALHYYRAVLERDPSDLEALAGEGQALAQKGALDKAKRNLARLQSICGDGCAPTRTLAAAINSAQTPAVAQAQAPAQPKVVSADATQPPVPISKN
jgi:tetratricopeptide (TPR) repeat protein